MVKNNSSRFFTHLTFAKICDMFNFTYLKKSFKEKDFVEFYCKKSNMVKKEIDPSLWELYYAKRNLSKIEEAKKEDWITLADGNILYNKAVFKPYELNAYEFKSLFEKEIIRGKKNIIGKDKMGRNKVSYQIFRPDVNYFSDLINMFELFRILGLVNKGVHPEKGSKIIHYYVPTSYDFKGLSEIQTQSLVTLELLKNPGVLNFLKDFIQQTENKNQKKKLPQ